jgi:FMN reductase (NADPH)
MTETKSEQNTSDTIETLLKRVTVREYADEPVSDEIVLKIMRAAQRSPTSSNMQAYSMVVVRDPALKKQINDLVVGGQKHIETCQVFIAVCADMSRVMAACKMHGKELVRMLEVSMVATVDATLVGMSLCLAAESLGLGTCMIGSMRNDAEEAARLLGLPEGVFVVFGMTIGWPANTPSQKPRMPEDLIFHFEKYNTRNAEENLRKFDLQLADSRRLMGYTTPDSAYTSKMAERFTKPVRSGLRMALERLGFNFD